jgi:nitrogen fixation protein
MYLSRLKNQEKEVPVQIVDLYLLKKDLELEIIYVKNVTGLG